MALPELPQVEYDPTAPAPATAVPTAPTTTPLPAPPKDVGVGSRIAGLISQDNAYMAAARTGAKQEAERRGLLSSSIAAGAGEAAAIRAALPIASQEAQQASQSQLQAEGAQQRGTLLAQDIAGQRQIQTEAAGQKQELLAADIAGKEVLANLDISSKERIANLNVASHDRDRAMSAAAVMESGYSDMFRTITASPDIPAETREKYLTHIAAIRDSSLNLVEQFYNVDLTWSTPI